MDNQELIATINKLDGSVKELTAAINSLTASHKDMMNSDPHDMMQTLNGSLQELIKTLENSDFKK